MFNGGLLVLVQMDLDQLRAIELDADPLANDLSRKDKIFKDGVVNGGESARTRPLLLVLHPRLPGRLGQDLSLAHKHHVLAAELLLQFAHQTRLDLLELLQLRHGHIDDHRLQKRNNVQYRGQAGFIFVKLLLFIKYYPLTDTIKFKVNFMQKNPC